MKEGTTEIIKGFLSIIPIGFLIPLDLSKFYLNPLIFKVDTKAFNTNNKPENQ